MDARIKSAHDDSDNFLVSSTPQIPSRSAALSRADFLHLCFAKAPIEGWAERRETFGCSGTRWACTHASKTRVNALTHASKTRVNALTHAPQTRVNALMTRDARLSALHRGGCGLRAALLSPAFAPDRSQRAPRIQVVMPGRRGPEPPGASGYEPPPQDATPRSAFRIVSRTRPQ
jgi:hypothetical protein